MKTVIVIIRYKFFKAYLEGLCRLVILQGFKGIFFSNLSSKCRHYYTSQRDCESPNCDDVCAV